MENMPINILAELVINSANDVLTGNQTFEEHLIYLQDEKNRHEREGIKLPLDLSEPIERETDDKQQQIDFRNKPGTGPSKHRYQREQRRVEKIQNHSQGFLFWGD